MRSAVIVLALTGVAHAGPAQDLQRAIGYFKGKQCDEAVPLLKDLLYPTPQLAGESNRCEAHIVLGACHYEKGRRDEAKTEFESCLAIDPTKTLEPLIYTEGQVRLFNETRADVEARAERDRKLRELEEERERLRRLFENTRDFERRSFAVNFAPLGAGQFQNGHRTKGFLVATGQGVTAATSVGIFIYLATKYGLSAKVPLEDAPGVRRLQQIEVASGIAFFGIYAYSIIDGIYHYKPRVQTELDPELLEELKKKPKPKTSRVHVGPVLLPGGAGIGLSWESD